MLNRAKVPISIIAVAVVFCILLPGICYAASYHVVQPKETLWGISRIYGLTVDELCKLNNLQSELIFPGQMLIVGKDDGNVETIVEGNESEEQTADEVNDLVGKILEFAKGLIGSPYKKAGSSPKGFDCSGFTSYVFKQFNIELPRVSGDQYNFGKAVSADEAKAGDLIAFTNKGRIFHVGIYLGNGEFIHSSSSQGVVITKTSDTYWGPRLLGFCRVLE